MRIILRRVSGPQCRRGKDEREGGGWSLYPLQSLKKKRKEKKGKFRLSRARKGRKNALILSHFFLSQRGEKERELSSHKWTFWENPEKEKEKRGKKGGYLCFSSSSGEDVEKGKKGEKEDPAAPFATSLN